jgi:hypothetical protein
MGWSRAAAGLASAFLLQAIAGASGRIGIIDWYGYSGLNPGRLRAALPFREGDRVPTEAEQEAARPALEKLAGREVRFASICCLEGGDSTLFVGLAVPGAPQVIYHPRPAADVRLPKYVLAAFRRADTALQDAVRRGAAGEDDSEGYALPKDPGARSEYLKIRDWTRAHTATVLHVLASSRYDDQREYAAVALGYAEASSEQVKALVRASFDASGGVRDEAIRALGVLCNLGTKITSQIPAERFIPLLYSLTWTDRNKAMMLFQSVTRQRDAAVLTQLREKALDPLREMAQWKDWNHAVSAMVLLGRIAGIEETRLWDLVISRKVDEILAAVR